MIHRDIKLKNIGIRRDADGKFYAVIADFGLSTVELDADIKKSDILHRTLPMKRRFLNAIQKFPKSLNWVKYFFNVHSKNVDDEILLIVKKLENVSCFTSKIRVHRTPNSRCSLYDCSGSFRANIPNINCSCFCVPWCGPWLLALVLSARKRIFI